MMRAFVLVALIGSSTALAETIQFPDDELATETVLPVFDRAPMVKNRKVKTAGRFELGGGMGFNLTDALYNKMSFALNGSYHFDELHGVDVTGFFIMPGLSDKGEQLKRGEGLQGGTFQADLAPSAKAMLLTNYQFNAYYGKISLAKNYVMNLTIFGQAGLGLVSFGDSTNFGVNAGVGQKFYLSENLAIRFDLRLFAYRGPDPTSDDQNLNGGAKRSSGDLSETTFYHTLVNFGVVYLL